MLMLVILSVFQLSDGFIVSVPAAKQPFTLEEVVTTSLYRPVGYSITWLPDCCSSNSSSQYLYTDGEERDIWIRDLATNTRSLFLKRSVLTEYRYSSYTVSPDRQYVLIAYDYLSQFRHSGKAKYVIYLRNDEGYIDIADQSYIQYATWSPTGSSLVYVLDNNIYYLSSPVGEPKQVTNDGVPGIIYNGVPDWVYEEEVFSSSSSVWFSPDGSSIAFASFNDTLVPDFTYSLYGNPGTAESQYPQQIDIRYPKTGATNPNVSLNVVQLSGDYNIKKLRAPVDVVTSDHVLFDVTWANNDEVVGVWTNRVQNVTTTLKYNLNTDTDTSIYSRSEPRGWTSPKAPLFSTDGDKFLMVEFQPVYGTNDEFPHITLYENGNATSITNGNYSVTSIITWDQELGIIYFQSDEEGYSTRHIFSVSESGDNKACLSCSLTFPSGNGATCSLATADFSADVKNCKLTCEAPQEPTITYLQTNKGLEILEDNTELRIRLENKLLPDILSTNIEIADGFTAKVRLVLPPDADTSGATKYPILIYAYGGPESAQIKSSFEIGFGGYLSTNLSVIYGLIDARNTISRGKNLMFAGYRNLGSVEMIDHINVTRILQEKYAFIDATRSAIWGWSYGGYTTGKSLELDTAGVFKCGISVAPVTNWIYYDSIYTERYMGLPTESDNLQGYQRGSLLNDVSNLKTKQYFLIHGTGDDNVHYQQSMLFTKVLEQNDVLFRQQSYTDQNHGIPDFTLHLYHTMDRFWRDCFNL